MSSQPESLANNENTDIQSPQELTAYVETVIQQLQTKFDDLSSLLIEKMDEMGSRIDTLEKSLGDLMQEAVAEENTELKA
ncbi:15335_t:CDS:2 [Acaulospora colombiana]|uniref:15335_t:CDS:1 n=1 Tax=Acaulospora colombiana TaxID=27376 RepID=A0ACA9LWV9_9GLOM|nr:15335_t:CDS:2 [Acaulospora colombiana]